MAVIEIQDITRDYGNGKGIFHVSFEIEKGEVFGFLGPNGAGKTTTIRHLMGFLHAVEGQCRIQGHDCYREADIIQKTLGYIPGEINLMEEMNGWQFLSFMAKYRGMKDRGRCEELLKRFELDPKGKIKRMSKGMKQKLGIIAAFMHDPEVLVLDEPTSGLDPLMQTAFVELILEEKKRGKSILMSSHIVEEVEKTCDRVGIIRQGHMVSIDDVDHLKQSRKKVYRISFVRQEDVQLFQTKLSCRVLSPTQVEVSIQKDINELIAALQGLQVIDLDVVEQTLEEVFMQFYGGESHVK